MLGAGVRISAKMYGIRRALGNNLVNAEEFFVHSLVNKCASS